MGAVATLCVLVSGCSLLEGGSGGGEPPAEQVRTAGPPAPEVPEYLRGLPLGNELNAFEVLTSDEVLQFDPCALQDPDAAAEVTGQQGDDIVPGESVTECTLRTVGAEGPGSGWRFHTEFKAQFDQDVSEKAARVTVAGQTFYRVQMEESCIFEHQLGDTAHGIALQVSGPYEDPAAKEKACQLGEAYLQATADRYAEPPLREQGRTEPQIRVFSPCVAIRQALETIAPTPGAVQTEISRLNPSQCEVSDAIPQPGASFPDWVARARVELQVSDDPQQLAERGIYPPTEVAGRPGVRNMREPSGIQPAQCAVDLLLDDRAVIDVNLNRPGSDVKAPVLSVLAPTCEQAETLATETLAAAGA